jgi:Tfp pilus assembly protein PilN
LRIRLDLRPENVKNVPPPKTRKFGLLMLCMFLFFGVLVSYTSLNVLNDILFLQDRVNTLSEKIVDLNAVKSGLTAELARLARQEAVYTSSLSIMQQELPTIEVFDSIDKSVIRGVILSSVALTQNELKLAGVANTEDNVVTTTRNLLDSGSLSVAQVPVVTRANMGPEGLRFSLSLIPLTIGDIWESGGK